MDDRSRVNSLVGGFPPPCEVRIVPLPATEQEAELAVFAGSRPRRPNGLRPRSFGHPRPGLRG